MATVLCVGHAVQDFVFTVPELPRTAGKHQASHFQSVGGGPAATAAVAIARLGGRAVLAARVGDDAVAEAIIGELEGYGVDCGAVLRLPGCASSLSAVMIDAAGERMIVNHLDRAMEASAAWLPDPATAGATTVLADCRWPEGAERALAAARDRSIPGVLDADTPVPRSGPLLQLASHVAFSAEALADYTGEADPVRGLRVAGPGLGGWCCVTAGAAGVDVLDAIGVQLSFIADAGAAIEMSIMSPEFPEVVVEPAFNRRLWGTWCEICRVLEGLGYDVSDRDRRYIW